MTTAYITVGRHEATTVRDYLKACQAGGHQVSFAESGDKDGTTFTVSGDDAAVQAVTSHAHKPTST